MTDKSVIICSNTYTLYNAIKIALSKKKKFDLIFILNDGKHYKNFEHYIKNYSKYKLYIKNLENLKIFNKTYFYFNKNSYLVRRLTTYFPFIFSLHILFSLKINKPCLYKNIYAPNRFFGIVFSHIVKYSNFYLYDEGFSSYTGLNDNDKIRKYSFIKNLIYKLEIKKILLNEVKIYFKKSKKTISIPKLKNNFNHKIEKIFNYKRNKLYKNNKIIYFPNLPNTFPNLINTKKTSSNKRVMINHISFIEKTITEKLSNFRYICRNSPLIQDPLIKDIKTDQLFNSWELECQNSINNDHILISLISTTLLLPKILFNKEPYLIFLNKLLDYNVYNANKVILNLKKLYKNKKKIFQPKNISEFEYFLKNVESLKKNNKK